MAIMGFLLHPEDLSTKSEAQKVTIIIAARNEEHTISNCLTTIINQDISKQFVEIILVDDASNDNTFKIAAEILGRSGIEHHLIQNQNHLGKKKSLVLAIEKSSSEFIVCRDADTFTQSERWLSSILNFMISNKKEFVICPVAIEYNNTFLSALQETEMSILSMFTISSSYFKTPFLCNGANLAFTKNIFYKTGAYKDHLHIPSGDDVFFLEQVNKIDPQTIGYLKDLNAVAYTFPEKKPGSFIHQKIRWSSKIFKTGSVINWLSAIIIGLTNITWIAAIFCLLIGGPNSGLGLFFILSKLLIDILLVFLASSFIKVKTKPLTVVAVGMIYPFYATLIAVLSMFVKPNWKRN
jgi:biofilm PGA synthesis N-glycosyltransferase PgaC